MLRHLLLFITNISLILLPFSSGTVPTTQFFPFGSGTPDSSITTGDDGSTAQLPLQIAFPFFNVLHDSLWVNINGVISFRSTISTYTPMCGRLSENYSMIAPFWADINLNEGGQVFYRETFDSGVLGKATNEMVTAFPELSQVKLKWAFIATWNKVAFFGSRGCSNARNLTNTFQTALTTDGIHSFALIYYNDITWTTGRAESSGGNCSGLGGTPAKAGFDAGDSKTFYTIPGSCEADIISINSRSNVGSSGKWIFRVDNSDIQSAGCSTEFNSTIRVFPSFIDMFGHVPIQIIGPCFEESAKLICQFHDPIKGVIKVPGFGSGTSTKQTVTCMAPFLYSSGRTRLDLIVKFKGTEREYSGFLYVISPDVSEKKLNIRKTGLDKDLMNLEFTWNPDIFPETDSLNLHLFKYSREHQEWERPALLKSNVPNKGSIQLSLKKAAISQPRTAYLFSLDPLLDSFTLIFSTSEDIYGFFNDKSSCLSWYKDDIGPPTDLQPCPPTAELYRVDDRFEVDPDCSSPEACKLHNPGADFCARSRSPSSSSGGQQCCYRKGNLYMDFWGAGRAQLSHSKRFIPHLINDTIPWLLCCKNKPADLCALYKKKRPSDSGERYIPPRPAGGTGDPHITTFDGLVYTFNGAGEFWLLKNQSSSRMQMAVQSRMEPFPDKSATVFTAFVMRCQSSPIVQVQRSAIRSVDIFVDGSRIDLSNQILFDVTFDGVQVTVAPDLSFVLVTFTCGFTFRITVAAEAFSIFTTADRKYHNQTQGLLGTYDENQMNDLQDPSGSVIPTNSSLSDIHYQFGMKWLVPEPESLFTCIDKSYADYHKPSFLPNFEQPDISQAPPEAVELCGQAIDCLYDYITTGNAAIANQTKVSSVQFNETVQIYEKEVIICMPLVNPENGYYLADSFMPGSIARYACYDNFALTGNEVVECSSSSGSWNGSAPVCLGTNAAFGRNKNVLLLFVAVLFICDFFF